MSKANKICKVCGKSYEACHTLKNDLNVFRWQDVACSPECGEKYFKMIMESRKPATKQRKASVKSAVSVEKAVNSAATAEAVEGASNKDE